jgi:hypothetical protein
MLKSMSKWTMFPVKGSRRTVPKKAASEAQTQVLRSSDKSSQSRS